MLEELPHPEDRRIAVATAGQDWAERLVVQLIEHVEELTVSATLDASSAAAMEVNIVLLAIAGETQLEAVRELARMRPDGPALVAIGRHGDPLLPEAVRLGADDCLVLPAPSDEVLMRLRVVADRRRLDREQALIRRIALSVAAGGDHMALHDLVAKELAGLLRADGGRVVQYTGPRQARLLGSWRQSYLEKIPRGTALDLAPSWALAQVQQLERPARSELTVADARVARAPLRASLAAPVRVGGEIWGAVAVAYSNPEAAHETALIELERVADLVGLAAANADARECLARLADTDPLTELANRRVFHQRLEEEVGRSRRSSAPVSLALVDLDHFKRVNDEHGHAAGDQALVAVADLLRRHARTEDVVARVGGEELAWLMPDAEISGATLAAERLRAALASQRLAEIGRLTASIGVAQHEPGSTPAALFERADTALYAAKAAGRDRVQAAQWRCPADRGGQSRRSGCPVRAPAARGRG